MDGGGEDDDGHFVISLQTTSGAESSLLFYVLEGTKGRGPAEQGYLLLFMYDTRQIEYSNGGILNNHPFISANPLVRLLLLLASLHSLF